MSNKRMSLENFKKETVRQEMLAKISGGAVSKPAPVQEACHPGDPKNAPSAL
jgi:hypothetical protein